MEFDKKKIPFFIIVIVAVLLLSRYYLQIFTLGLSLVFLGYSAKKKNTFLLTLGLLGLFVAGLIHKNAKDKQEGFQNSIIKVAESKELQKLQKLKTLKGEVPVKKCNIDETGGTAPTKIKVSELANLEYMFNIFFRIPPEKVRTIIKENCFEDIFDAINSSYNYKKQEESEQEVNNWRLKETLMDKIGDLYHIYNLSIKTVGIIINKHKKDFNDVVNSNFIISEFGIDSIEKLSVDYFIQTKKFSEKQFKLLEFLEIIDKDNKHYNKLKNLKPLELYYSQKVKDLGSLMICFEHYGIIKTNDLKTRFPDDDLSGDNWVVQTLEQVKLDDYKIENEPIFKKYKIVDKIKSKIEKVEKERKEEVESKLIDFSKPGSLLFEQLNKTDPFEVNRELQNNEISEYQKFIVNKTTKESEESKKALSELNDIETIRSKTLGTLNNIVDDTRKLMAEVGNYETFNTGKNNKNNTLKSYFDKYIMFFKGFINILIKDQRAFFVGIILIVLSVITNFIEVSKN